jgi:hypothetical protein
MVKAKPELTYIAIDRMPGKEFYQRHALLNVPTDSSGRFSIIDNLYRKTAWFKEKQKMSNYLHNLTTRTRDPVRQLLDQDRPQEALNLLKHLGQNSASSKNIQSVCLLRLGKIHEAISILSEITFQGNICIPPETPVVFQTNFATAMLMANNKESAISVIERLDDKQHPAVARIRNAIRTWEKGLNLFQRLLCKAGIYPGKAIPVDFVPGDID